MSDLHPLLARERINDIELELDFEEFMVGMVSAPDLTFQYSEKGELNGSSIFTTTPICSDAPEIYRASFINRWTVTGRIDGLPDLHGETCWQRLQELVRGQLEAMPDNPFVLENAWLAGLIPDMPPRFAAMLRGLHERIAAHRREQQSEEAATELAATTGERQPIRWWMTDECCNGCEDCSFDSATEYVYPNGTRKTEYTCCF